MTRLQIRNTATLPRLGQIVKGVLIVTSTCLACGEERHRGSCADPIPLDADDLARPINQDLLSDTCEDCGDPLNEDEQGSSVCLDCYNDRRMADSSESDDSDTWECPDCGAHVDLSFFDDQQDCPNCYGGM